MKNFVLMMAFSTSVALVAVACGDDESGGDDGKGGSAGSAGSSGSSGTSGSGGGGTSGSGGTPPQGGSAGTPSGGSAGTGTGGSSGTDAGGEGGMGATGGDGEGGMTGEGGDGPGPGMDCPAGEPASMTACDARGLSCDYGDRVCRCMRATGNWQCFDEAPNCPAMPNDGAECAMTMTACSYGEEGTCVCQNPMGPPPEPEWVCDAGLVVCPTTPPADESSCTDFPASYVCGECTCGTGMARTWDCGGGNAMCPEQAPDSEDPCPTAGVVCEYDPPGPTTNTCVCNASNEWQCGL